MESTIKLNNGNQMAVTYKKLYNETNCTSVNDYYQTFSTKRRKIENAIKAKMQSVGGKDYRVLCGNNFYFTCGYTSSDSQKLYIESSTNTYEIEL